MGKILLVPKSVIFHKEAAKPIGAEHGKHFLVCDDPKDMADLINKIYENPKNFEFLKLNARDFIKNNFTWQIYEKKLLNVIDNVLNNNRSF